VLGPGDRLRAVGNISGKSVLHGQKARLDAAIVMDEILDPEFHPVVAAENDPELFRHWFTSHGRQHFRVATELNGVIWFRSLCQRPKPDTGRVRRV